MDRFQTTAIMIGCLALIILPLSITSIVLGTRDKGCDYVDVMGLNVGEWLVGGGWAGIILLILLLPSLYSPVVGVIIFVCYALFSVAWFIVGAIVLFRSNLDCIKGGSTMMIYALVIWCIQAFHCIFARRQSEADK